MINTRVSRVALAGVLCLGLAAAASAQDRRPAPGADRQKQFEDRNHRREQRLHDLLQIKPDQEGAFRTFLAALEQARPERDQARGRDEAAPLTTPERLDRQARRFADAQQRLQKTSAAVKTFYAALTPEQRKAFDAMPMLVRAGDDGRGPGGRFMFMRRGPGQGPGPGRGGPPPL